MKRKVLFILLLTLCIISTGCTRSITYQTFKDNIKDKKTMIVEVVQDGCSHCEAFDPIFSKFMKKHNLKYLKLNITHIDDNDFQELNAKYNVEGTPHVLIIEKGKLSEYSISGSVKEKTLENIFKKAGYIK